MALYPGVRMNEDDAKIAALDREILEEAALVHRRIRPRLQRLNSPGHQALRALLEAPDGKLEIPTLASEAVRR